ncbi:hypothetical protein [Synechococcus sp. KORDI-52]|uniref:hypothetical protein n=1 Tax=Synechococcus sp. KORDI-52 TaxID=585425 RepID=UPI0012EB553D|nr:hypothetical protein [Synechococcus sp. KORDI-52]
MHDKRPDVFSRFCFSSYEHTFDSVGNALKLVDFCGIEFSRLEVLRLQSFVERSRVYLAQTYDPSDPLELLIKKGISRLLDRDAHRRFCDVTGVRRDYFP